MVKIINILLVLFLIFAMVSCSTDAPKIIAQQKVGDKVVMILSSTGTITKGAGSFYIEFHNASDNVFSDVGKIDADAKMQMAGNPMIGELTITKTEIPGRYAAKYNFPMSGSWILVVYFEVFGKAQFELNVN
jgi:hypothetical protein